MSFDAISYEYCLYFVYLHLLSAGCIARLVQSVSISQELDEGKRVNGRVRGVAKTKHLPASHTIRPLKCSYSK